MSVSVTLLPDGSVAVTDGNVTFPPLSPAAVQAIAAQADASAQAHRTQSLSEALGALAQLIPPAGFEAGADAYAQVTVIPGSATVVVDPTSFSLVRARLPGRVDPDGNWLWGPLTIKPQPAATTPIRDVVEAMP